MRFGRHAETPQTSQQSWRQWHAQSILDVGVGEQQVTPGLRDASLHLSVHQCTASAPSMDIPGKRQASHARQAGHGQVPWA